MGAEPFIAAARGDTAAAAFRKAVGDAAFGCGHGGYTGTIAEKDSFVEIGLPEGADPAEEARRLIDSGEGRIADKWGPAGAFALGDGRYLFFGWASS